MTRIASTIRPALAALLLGAAFIPAPAHARVFIGFGFGFPYAYPYPYYYRPPVVVAVPPPVYYPPPAYPAPPPAYYAPPPAYAVPAAGSTVPFSTRCNAGSVICPLPTAVPVGNSCSCPGAAGRLNGRVG